MSVLSTSPVFRGIGHTQRGVALVMAVLIVAIIVTATTFLAFEQQLWIRQSENIADHALTESVRRGALEGALIILSEDAKDNITDDLEESWHSAPLGGEVGRGMFIGQIDDAQGRFNLNSLVKKDGQPDPKYLAVFRRLLSLNDIDPNLADAVVDWIDADGQQRPYGAEDISYLGQQIPYRAANQSFSSVEELVLVQGFDAEMLNKLRDYLSALPEPTPININTASALVLKAMFISPPADNVIQEIIDNRRPFKDPKELLAGLPGQAPPEVDDYSVKTDYFNVNVAVKFGRLNRYSQALVHRKNDKTAEIVWQNQQVLILTNTNEEPETDA